MGEKRRRLTAGLGERRPEAWDRKASPRVEVFDRPVPRSATEPVPDDKPRRDFKADRRMFAHVAGELRVTSVGDRRFHREWLSDVSDLDFRRVVRGYHLDDVVVFYKASFEPVSSRVIREILPALKAAMDLADDVVVYSGARTTGPDDDLVGSHRMGTVGEMCEDDE